MLICYRSLVYVEGEASMNKFTAKDGTPQSALSIVQRESSLLFQEDDSTDMAV